jgi:hypothetical protein
MNSRMKRTLKRKPYILANIDTYTWHISQLQYQPKEQFLLGDTALEETILLLQRALGS